MWTFIGACAAALTTFSFVPQIVKVAHRKRADDVSVLTLGQLSCGVGLWILYGIHRQDWVIITANTITLSLLLILIGMVTHYKRKDR